MKLIFEKSRPGRTGVLPPEPDVPEAPPLPAGLLRSSLDLPEISESEAIRHYTALSRRNLGVDNAFYPLGSCTMKYNPRLNEVLARLDAFRNSHPLLPASVVQGNLQLLYELQRVLSLVTGLPAVSLAPAAGAHGELTGLMIAKKYFREKGEERDVVLTPDSSHGTNPASAAMCGYTVTTIPSGPDGRLDPEELKRRLSPRVACLMLTNPNTLGIFEKDVVAAGGLVHEAGGLVYGDGANANALLGKALFSSMGFDLVHLNLHKTFSTPHGGGGPGAGALAVTDSLAPYLPSPVVGMNRNGYAFISPEKSIGRIRTFHGNFGVLVRAFAYITALGSEGLEEATTQAVLNACYLRKRLEGHYHVAYPSPSKHEFVLDDSGLPHGVTMIDVAKRLLDYGFHPPTVAFPLIVHGALMIEPTETETRETLDEFADALIAVRREAESDPELVKTAPHSTPVRRLDEVRAARKPDLGYDFNAVATAATGEKGTTEIKLIVDGALTGAENMARDEALLAEGRPVVRFYRWSPPCVSIGYFQDPARDIDLEFLKRKGIDFVRRPTGGRAVLHEHELTYAIVLPGNFLPSGIVPSYRKIASVFLAALAEWGVRGELKGPAGRPDRSGSCFASVSAYEITVDGRKIIGSAQVRRRGVVLQHGSLLLAVDYDRQAACLRGPSACTAEELREKMTGLYALKGEIGIDTLVEGISRAFESEFGVRLTMH
ncbi:MAG: aminomethyl-transferring glycine dehydrogenase subunit GcvPB [Spirochaetales bacterium]|nr:aminomethyl-transferring glycine dehydrogenase subunit GcvPB [Spirochaetales bacterium]